MARGPAYPYIDLGTAVNLARKTYEFTRRSSAPLDSVIKEAWGYSPTSSSGVKVFAAMKYYGLVDANDAGESLRLSDRGYRIVVDDPESEEWRTAVREAALSPRWYRFCWEKWGPEMPPSMKRSLIFEHGFVETTVDGFLRDYKKTVEFAKLETVRTEETKDAADSASQKEKDENESNAVDVAKGGNSSKRNSPSGANMRQEVFSLPEGTVAVEWPGNLSLDSYQDLSDWLDILKRKIGRAAKQSQGGKPIGPENEDSEFPSGV